MQGQLLLGNWPTAPLPLLCQMSRNAHVLNLEAFIIVIDLNKSSVIFNIADLLLYLQKQTCYEQAI